MMRTVLLTIGLVSLGLAFIIILTFYEDMNVFPLDPHTYKSADGPW